MDSSTGSSSVSVKRQAIRYERESGFGWHCRPAQSRKTWDLILPVTKKDKRKSTNGWASAAVELGALPSLESSQFIALLRFPQPGAPATASSPFRRIQAGFSVPSGPWGSRVTLSGSSEKTLHFSRPFHEQGPVFQAVFKTGVLQCGPPRFCTDQHGSRSIHPHRC